MGCWGCRWPETICCSYKRRETRCGGTKVGSMGWCSLPPSLARSPSVSSKQAGGCQHFVDVLEEQSGDCHTEAAADGSRYDEGIVQQLKVITAGGMNMIDFKFEGRYVWVLRISFFFALPK